MKPIVSLSLLLVLALSVSAFASDNQDYDAIRAAEELAATMQISLEPVTTVAVLWVTNSPTQTAIATDDYDALRVADELATTLQVTPELPIDTPVNASFSFDTSPFSDNCEAMDDYDECRVHCELEAILQI